MSAVVILWSSDCLYCILFLLYPLAGILIYAPMNSCFSELLSSEDFFRGGGGSYYGMHVVHCTLVSQHALCVRVSQHALCARVSQHALCARVTERTVCTCVTARTVCTFVTARTVCMWSTLYFWCISLMHINEINWETIKWLFISGRNMLIRWHEGLVIIYILRWQLSGLVFLTKFLPLDVDAENFIVHVIFRYRSPVSLHFQLMFVDRLSISLYQLN